MPVWSFRIKNRTGKPLLLRRTSDNLALPPQIADGADQDVSAGAPGEVDYVVRPEEQFGARWSAELGVSGFGLGLEVAEERSGGTYVFTVTAGPAYCYPVFVTSGDGATICLPDYRQTRTRIAEAAEAEADKWVEADKEPTEPDKEKKRLPLRLEYADAWKPDAYKDGMKRTFKGHDGGTQSWCGVFGVWSVQRARPAGVHWTLKPGVGGGPVGVLKCTDVNKIHTGDIGHVWDDMQAQARRYAEWEANGKQGSPPVIANHHCLVTRGPARPVTTVEGNAGLYANAYNVVLRNHRDLGQGSGRIDFFYCSVPHPRCVLLAKQLKRPNECPFQRRDQECPLPDP